MTNAHRHAAGALLALLLSAGCASRSNQSAVAAPPPPPAPGPAAGRGAAGVPGPAAVTAQDRLLIRQAALTLLADRPSELVDDVTMVATEAGGFVENSSATESRIEMHLRIPAAQLPAVLTRMEALGEVTQRQESARDVTEQTLDLEARLATMVALRDRLRTLLQSAANVQDAVAVERELARVQSDIDSMEARLKYLRSHVALAQLTVRIEQRRVLGPLGWVVAGAAWVISKLFVIK